MCNLRLQEVSGEVIPPISSVDGFEKHNELSDYYYAIVKTIGGNEVKSTVRYDHNRKRWLISLAGGKEVLKYYIEIIAP